MNQQQEQQQNTSTPLTARQLESKYILVSDEVTHAVSLKKRKKKRKIKKIKKIKQNTSTPLTAIQRAVVVRIMSEARRDKRPIFDEFIQQISSTPLTTRQIFEKYTTWQTHLQTRSKLSRWLVDINTHWSDESQYLQTQEEDEANKCSCCDNYSNCNNPDAWCYDYERCQPYADDEFREETCRGPWFPEFNKQQVRRELKLRNPECFPSSRHCDYEHDEDGKCICPETREIVQVEEQPILAALYEPEDIAHLPIVRL